MKCELCGIREASILIQEKRPDSTREYNICLDCARSRGLASINPQAAQVLASIIAGNASPGAPLVPPSISSQTNASLQAPRVPRVPLTESICPACGTKFMDAKKTATIVCIRCW